MAMKRANNRGPAVVWRFTLPRVVDKNLEWPGFVPVRERNAQLFSFLTRSLVAVQIASDWYEYQEKARSIQVYMSTFDAGIGQIRGELNSYRNAFYLLTVCVKNVTCRPRAQDCLTQFRV
jgi:hypothetical protein